MNSIPPFDFTSLRSNLPDPDSNSTRFTEVQNQNKRTTSVTRFDEVECATSTTSTTPESLKLHSDYLRNILSFLNKKDARSLNLVSKNLNNEVNLILREIHLPKTLPDNIRAYKLPGKLLDCDMQEEAKKFPSTKQLVKRVNDELQWDAEFVIHCLDKTKSNENYRKNRRRVLSYASELGDMALLNLLKHHKLINVEDVRSNNNEALRNATTRNHMDVIHFLKNEFRLTTADARGLDNSPLRVAIAMGHIVVIRFLKDEFGLTGDDARKNNNLALCCAAQNGHVDVLRVLKNEFGLTANDARTEDNDALKMAAYNGHVEVLRFLKNEFGLTAEDARTNNNEALRNAYRNGHIKVVEFFEQEWGLTLS